MDSSIELESKGVKEGHLGVKHTVFQEKVVNQGTLEVPTEAGEDGREFGTVITPAQRSLLYRALISQEGSVSSIVGEECLPRSESVDSFRQNDAQVPKLESLKFATEGSLGRMDAGVLDLSYSSNQRSTPVVERVGRGQDAALDLSYCKLPNEMSQSEALDLTKVYGGLGARIARSDSVQFPPGVSSSQRVVKRSYSEGEGHILPPPSSSKASYFPALVQKLTGKVQASSQQNERSQNAVELAVQKLIEQNSVPSSASPNLTNQSMKPGGVMFTTQKNHEQTDAMYNALYKYKCNVCPKRFKNKALFKVHMCGHKDPSERPFQCDTCGCRFLHQHNLVVHQRKHTGEKPFKCPHCDHAFMAVFLLHKHLRRHGIENSKEVGGLGSSPPLLTASVDVGKEQSSTDFIAGNESRGADVMDEPPELLPVNQGLDHGPSLDANGDISGGALKVVTGEKGDNNGTSANISPQLGPPDLTPVYERGSASVAPSAKNCTSLLFLAEQDTGKGEPSPVKQETKHDNMEQMRRLLFGSGSDRVAQDSAVNMDMIHTVGWEPASSVKSAEYCRDGRNSHEQQNSSKGGEINGNYLLNEALNVKDNVFNKMMREETNRLTHLTEGQSSSTKSSQSSPYVAKELVIKSLNFGSGQEGLQSPSSKEDTSQLKLQHTITLPDKIPRKPRRKCKRLGLQRRKGQGKLTFSSKPVVERRKPLKKFVQPSRTSKSEESHRFECSTCHKTFQHGIKLHLHMASHLFGKTKRSRKPKGVERPRVECKVCSRSFQSPHHLYVHMGTHTGYNQEESLMETTQEYKTAPVYLFSCKYCPKKFKYNGNLSKHLQVHEGRNKQKRAHTMEASENWEFGDENEDVDGDDADDGTIIIDISVESPSPINSPASGINLTETEPQNKNEISVRYDMSENRQYSDFVKEVISKVEAEIAGFKASQATRSSTEEDLKDKNVSVNESLKCSTKSVTNKKGSEYICEYCGQGFTLKGSYSNHVKIHKEITVRGLKYSTEGMFDPAVLQNKNTSKEPGISESSVVEEKGVETFSRDQGMSTSSEQVGSHVHVCVDREKNGSEVQNQIVGNKTVDSSRSFVVGRKSSTIIRPYKCLYCKRKFKYKGQQMYHMAFHQTTASPKQRPYSPKLPLKRQKKPLRSKLLRGKRRRSRSQKVLSFRTTKKVEVDEDPLGSDQYNGSIKTEANTTDVLVPFSSGQKKESLVHNVSSSTSNVSNTAARPTITAISSKTFSIDKTVQKLKGRVGRNPVTSCRICKTPFYEVPKLKVHMVEMHGVEETHLYECSSCKHRFTQRCSLYRHRKLHCGNRELHCKVCNETFMKRRSFEKHMELHVHQNKQSIEEAVVAKRLRDSVDDAEEADKSRIVKSSETNISQITSPSSMSAGKLQALLLSPLLSEYIQAERDSISRRISQSSTSSEVKDVATGDAISLSSPSSETGLSVLSKVCSKIFSAETTAVPSSSPPKEASRIPTVVLEMASQSSLRRKIESQPRTQTDMQQNSLVPEQAHQTPSSSQLPPLVNVFRCTICGAMIYDSEVHRHLQLHLASFSSAASAKEDMKSPVQSEVKSVQQDKTLIKSDVKYVPTLEVKQENTANMYPGEVNAANVYHREVQNIQEAHSSKVSSIPSSSSGNSTSLLAENPHRAHQNTPFQERGKNSTFHHLRTYQGPLHQTAGPAALKDESQVETPLALIVKKEDKGLCTPDQLPSDSDLSDVSLSPEKRAHLLRIAPHLLSSEDSSRSSEVLSQGESSDVSTDTLPSPTGAKLLVKQPIIQELRNKIKARRRSQGLEDLKVEFRKPEPTELSEEERAKLNTRRESNRQAAQRSRLRRKHLIDTLLKELQKEELKNKRLRQQSCTLEGQKNSLLQVVESYKCVTKTQTSPK